MHTCKVTRHQQSCNHNIKSYAFFHNPLFGLGPLLPCLHSLTPSPRRCAEQQLCSPPFCSSFSITSSLAGFLLTRGEVSGQRCLALYVGSAVLGGDWVRKSQPGGKVPRQRAAGEKGGVQASPYTAVSDGWRSQDGSNI